MNTASNDLSLLRRGTITVVPDNMAGSVRVGSICISRELGLEKLLDFRGALTLFAVCMGKQCKGVSDIVYLGRANHYIYAVGAPVP